MSFRFDFFESKDQTVPIHSASKDELTSTLELIELKIESDFNTPKYYELKTKNCNFKIKSLSVEQLLPIPFNTDLVKGVYEGGQKLWECSVDLLDFIHFLSPLEIEITERDNILELGCGLGLPGIASILKFPKCNSYVFSDFNKEIVENLTWSNIVLNIPESFLTKIKCVAGDWDGFLNSNKPTEDFPSSYKLIITAETLYSTESAKKVYKLISKLLSIGGLAIIATKRYYFGVGGGFKDFLDEMIKDLAVDKYQTVHKTSFEDGFSNIRDIIMIKKLML